LKKPDSDTSSEKAPESEPTPRDDTYVPKYVPMDVKARNEMNRGLRTTEKGKSNLENLVMKDALKMTAAEKEK